MLGIRLSVHNAVSHAILMVACAHFTDGEPEAQGEGFVLRLLGQGDAKPVNHGFPLECPQYRGAVAVDCVLGRWPKGRKENILGVEKLSTDFPPWAVGRKYPQLSGENTGMMYLGTHVSF